MALRDWIWFKEGYASEEKVPTDIAKWKFLISQLKTLNTKAALQVRSPPPKNRETIAAAYTPPKLITTPPHPRSKPRPTPPFRPRVALTTRESS